MAGQDQQLASLANIFAADTTVASWVLIGGDSATEQVAGSLALSVVNRHVGERPILLVERPPDHRYAVVVLRKTGCLPHRNLNLLEGFEDG